ncbi:hypothetical protein P879_04985 [Paragonimus westermani]|uniref:Cyclic nucleotide-binding domain-containing protein n=1 Tax=Paragonimus westermani TaxID=34504 RepID=A0A8T0DCS2_9TREM|nr:hypothetical protein P879_04985 [Paragonimus westermani]
MWAFPETATTNYIPISGTDATKTEEHELQLTAQLRGPDVSRRSVTWWNRHPGRKLVVRQPFCTACLAPHRKHFVRFPEKPCIRIEVAEKTHEDGVSLEEDSPEIVGQEIIDLKEFGCSLPAWIPNTEEIWLSTFSPYNMPYLLWLLSLTCAVVYNFVSIPLREAFDIYDDDIIYRRYWQFGNSVADVIYLMDILFVRPRIEFLEGGITKFDIISVIPLDLCSLFYEKEMARFRILRLFKVHAFWDTFERLDQRLNAGYAVRLARTMIYMIYIIHLETCGFYTFNRIQGMNATTWSIPSGRISPYVYSFYVCLKTATSIGSLPAATNPYEFMFMTSYWLTGIFVSAILIGQIIDILDSANANKVNYRRIMDATLSCMHHLHAPVHVVDKVRKWFLYNWEQQKTFDENSLFEVLPIKLKSDLAISVHFHTLSKVSLFQNCERALIYDMILKLKPVVFLPMDYICRKGEVGKEMYIVKSGVVEVVGGPNNSIVFVTLKEGTVFGEISLLALSGKNRRTADVRSQGFSTLFSLSKEDFEEIMKNYPQAHQILKKRSQRMLNRDKKKAREEEKARKAQQQAEQEAMGLHTDDVMEVIVERPPTPRLLETVVQVLEASCPENPITQELRRRSTRNSLELRQLHSRRISTSPSQLSRLRPTKGVNKTTNKEQSGATTTETATTQPTVNTSSHSPSNNAMSKELPGEEHEEANGSEMYDPTTDIQWLERLQLKRNLLLRLKQHFPNKC